MALTNKLSLAWTGDYESLKQFVRETCKLDGSWDQPGGDRKLFTVGDSKILWKKNKSLLSFDGPRANVLREELCRRLCERNDGNLDPVVVHNTGGGHSSELSDLYSDMEHIKQDQLANGEVIRTLSESILHITSAISEFRDYIGNNKTSLSERASTRSINHNEKSENGNQVITQDPIEIDDNDSIVSDQLVNSMGHTQAEHISQLDDSSEVPSRTINETLTVSTADCIAGEQYVNSNVDEEPEAVVHQKTYAQVVKSIKNLKCNEEPSTFDKSENTSQNHLPQGGIDADGFIGVDRRRKRTKKFFISGIHESVKESQILSYLEQRNITPTHISLFRSQRRGTRSAKIHIPSLMGSLVQTESFWPKFVKCRLWQPKTVGNSTVRGTRTKITTHLGEYSTYV